MTVSQHSAAGSVEPATAVWWLFVVWGIASVVLGVSLLFQPIASALVLVTMVAVFWLVGGIVDIVGALVHRTSHWVWRIAGGAFSVIVGLFVLGHPLIGTLAAVSALYLLVGLSALSSGLTGLFGGDRSTARIVLSGFQIVLACLMLVGFLDVVNLRVLVQAIGLIAIGGGIVARDVPPTVLRQATTAARPELDCRLAGYPTSRSGLPWPRIEPCRAVRRPAAHVVHDPLAPPLAVVGGCWARTTPRIQLAQSQPRAAVKGVSVNGRATEGSTGQGSGTVQA